MISSHFSFLCRDKVLKLTFLFAVIIDESLNGTLTIKLKFIRVKFLSSTVTISLSMFPLISHLSLYSRLAHLLAYAIEMKIKMKFEFSCWAQDGAEKKSWNWNGNFSPLLGNKWLVKVQRGGKKRVEFQPFPLILRHQRKREILTMTIRWSTNHSSMYSPFFVCALAVAVAPC